MFYNCSFRNAYAMFNWASARSPEIVLSASNLSLTNSTNMTKVPRIHLIDGSVLLLDSSKDVNIDASFSDAYRG